MDAGSVGAQGLRRRAALKRTVKACGSDVRGAGVKFAGGKLLAGDGGKKAVLRGDHVISRKAIAQGRPECFR